WTSDPSGGASPPSPPARPCPARSPRCTNPRRSSGPGPPSRPRRTPRRAPGPCAPR
ncbi:MAG: hypothetical protein AVDCRST_MAG54-2216, partial [uncultured Actinomycetospora sp.]